MRNSDTESERSYCSSGERSGDSSDYSNDSPICTNKNVKSDYNNSNDYSTPYMGMRRADNYKDRGKRKQKLAGHSSTKGLKHSGKSTKANKLSACKESYYDSYSKVAERNTKQGKVLIKCKVPHPGEKHNPNGSTDVMWGNRNNKKSKQSGKHKNNDSSKNGVDEEPILFDENCCSRGKKKGKTRGLRHGKHVRKYNLQSSSHVRNKKSPNMKTIHPLECQNGACAGIHNIVSSKPDIKQSSNVERCSCVHVKNTPDEKFCARNETANVMSRSTPKRETLTNREMEVVPLFQMRKLRLAGEK